MRTDNTNIFDPKHTFWTSDTHFGHSNIIKFCNRPFKGVDEMEEKLVENWNKVVSETDTVFHLGDFAFGGFPLWERVRARLNGYIYLIQGNHDIRQNTQNMDRLLNMFEAVSPQMQIEVDGQPIIMNHYPFLCYAGSYNNRTWALHGHCHSGPDSTGIDDSRLIWRFPTQYDVGVDNNNFTPIGFYQLKDIISKQVEKYEEREDIL